MFLIDLLFALVVALLFGWLFAVAFRRPGPWSAIWVFFLLIFLFAWAGGVWLAPFGPVLWGGYWLPFVLVGLIVALLLAAATPARPPRTPGEAVAEARFAAAAESALTAFFWVLVVVLLVAIVAHYL